MSAIKPFKAIEGPQRNKLATRKWTTKFLRTVLGKLNITGKGLNIKQTGDGHLHLEVENGEATTCTHAFKLSVSPDLTGIIVSPGQAAVSGVGRTPTLNGRSLEDTEGSTGAPVLVPAIGTGYVWVKIPAKPQLGTVAVGEVLMSYLLTSVWPSSAMPIIEAGSTVPNDVAASINFETGATTDGLFYITLGRYTRAAIGLVTINDQRWISNVGLSITGNGSASKYVY